MGQAKQRGSKEERVAQAKKRQEETPSLSSALNLTDVRKVMSIASRLDPLFASLTTPAVIDDRVTLFAQKLSDNAPLFLDCQPEPWSRQSCCNLNVAKFIEMHGGRILCGYRIWYAQPRYIEGERHAVWTDGTTIRDVSFVDTGETKIVFVPDDQAFDGVPAKVRFAFEEADKQALAAYESLMGLVPISTMLDEQAWDTFPTHEEWLAGKRMSNLIPSLG